MTHGFFDTLKNSRSWNLYWFWCTQAILSCIMPTKNKSMPLNLCYLLIGESKRCNQQADKGKRWNWWFKCLHVSMEHEVKFLSFCHTLWVILFVHHNPFVFFFFLSWTRVWEIVYCFWCTFPWHKLLIDSSVYIDMGKVGTLVKLLTTGVG